MPTFFTRAVRTAVFIAAAMAVSFTSAYAQTTLILDAPGTQVTDVMIRAGASANTNFNGSDALATSASLSFGDLRRALVKFDTQNTIPAKTVIQSAVMTLTVKSGGAAAVRSISLFPVTASWTPEQATWNARRAGTAWTSAGGDLGPLARAQDVSNVAGSKAAFDVTALVRAAVSGSSSVYTRVALVDLGAASADSYREYYSSRAVEPSVRPVLRIVYGGSAPVTATTTTTVPVPPAPAPVITPGPCAVALDKATLSVGETEANWSVNVATAAACAWSATSDAAWLVVKSVSPVTAVGSGYAKVRAVTNTVSAAKRTGHVYVNGAVYTVTQGGCGTACATTTQNTPPPPPATGGAPVVVPPPAPGPAVTLRVLQFNTHHGGWGSDGVYSIDRIADWIIKSNADLVSLNEIERKDSWSNNLDQSVLYQNLLQQRTGQTWYMVYVSAYGTGSGIGNVVLSKFPFIATASNQMAANRASVDATVDVNGRTINFTSAHMDNVSQANRLKETSELLPWALGLAEDRIICGDWNAGPETTEIANMRATYGESWTGAKALGTAAGNGITHGSHQIDYIFYSKTAAHLTLVSSEMYKTADANGVMPSDHEPIMAIFEVR